MKSTVTLSKVKFQELVSRGLNRPMIAKELGITVKLVNEAFIRWDLKVKKTANAVIWDDEDNAEATKELIASYPDITTNLDETGLNQLEGGETFYNNTDVLTTFTADDLGISDTIVIVDVPVISSFVTKKIEDLEEATF